MHFKQEVPKMLTKQKNNQFVVVAVTTILFLLAPGCAQQKQKTTNLTIPTRKKIIETKVEDKDVAKVDISNKRRKKYFRDLNYEEHKQVKNKLLKNGKRETAITHIEKMIPLCDEIHELRDLKLEIADLYFETGSLKKAETLYSEFAQLYPGDGNIEYAIYKLILCSYWLTLDNERDQSQTRSTINQSKKFLEQPEIFNQYNSEVKQILVSCQNRLLESEINVFNFYINQGDYLSAKTRLANIEKEFLKELPEVEPQLIMLTCQLAEKINDKELLAKKQEELQTRFPDYQENINNTIVIASRLRPSSSEVLANGEDSVGQAARSKVSFLDKF